MSKLELNDGKIVDIEYDYNEGVWKLLDCICKEDWSDGTAYCQQCHKPRR